MKASKVAELIQAEDGDQVAHGYTFDRKTVSIYWTENGFERYDEVYPYDGVGNLTEMGEEFDSSLFFDSIKRFYDSRTNPLLIDLFKTFGRPLPLTPG